MPPELKAAYERQDAAKSQNVGMVKEKRHNGGRRRLYDKRAAVAVEMKQANPLVENATIEDKMKDSGLKIPDTKAKRRSMWNSIYHHPLWKKHSGNQQTN